MRFLLLDLVPLAALAGALADCLEGVLAMVEVKGRRKKGRSVGFERANCVLKQPAQHGESSENLPGPSRP